MVNRHDTSPGGDPRQNPIYQQLRDEICTMKAETDWQKIEMLCMLLFHHHGTDLRSAVWFTAARMNINGMEGMLEGLKLMESLISHHWATMWPRAASSRLDALSWLAGQMRTRLRTVDLNEAQRDMADKHLSAIHDTLLRHDNRAVDPLMNVAEKLRNISLTPAITDVNDTVLNDTDTDVLAPVSPMKNQDICTDSDFNSSAPSVPLVFFRYTFYRDIMWWRGTLCGILFTIILSPFISLFQSNSPEKDALLKSVQTTPAPLSSVAAGVVKTKHLTPLDLTMLKPVIISETQKYLDMLALQGVSEVNARAGGGDRTGSGVVA